MDRIVVLGGGGHVGSHVVAELVATYPGTIVIADYRVEQAKRLAIAMGPRVEADFVDANVESSLISVLKGASAAVGCIGPFYRYAVPMAQAAIGAEVNYVDVCDDPGPVETLLALDGAARHAGIALVTGVGWTPGVTNLLAIKGAAELDAVHEIKLSWVGSSADSTGLAVIMHLFHAISGVAPMYQDGAWIQAAAGSGEEVIEFPAPLGQVTVSHCGHPEPLTLPRYMSVRTVSVKGGLVPGWNSAMARGLARLGLIGTPAKNRRVAKLVHSVEGVLRLGGVRASGARVDVIGTKDGEPRTVSYAATAPMGRLTGIPAATCARWLAAGRLPTGAYAPEGCLDHEAFLAELSERGITCQRMV